MIHIDLTDVFVVDDQKLRESPAPDQGRQS